MSDMKDAFYFPHDSNAKDDPKCITLIEQMGLEGYGIYWVLLEMLRDQPTYRYPLELIPAIARRYNTTPEKINAVVFDYGLFVIEDDLFSSVSFLRRMETFEWRREVAQNAGKASAKARLKAAKNSVDGFFQPSLPQLSDDLGDLHTESGGKVIPIGEKTNNPTGVEQSFNGSSTGAERPSNEIFERRKKERKESNQRKEIKKEEIELAPPLILGSLRNVLLTQDELDRLSRDFPNEIDYAIEWLSLYIDEKGYKIRGKTHNACFRRWAMLAARQRKAAELNFNEQQKRMAPRQTMQKI
jgi:hypothetical protein